VALPENCNEFVIYEASLDDEVLRLLKYFNCDYERTFKRVPGDLIIRKVNMRLLADYASFLRLFLNKDYWYKMPMEDIKGQFIDEFDLYPGPNPTAVTRAFCFYALHNCDKYENVEVSVPVEDPALEKSA